MTLPESEECVPDSPPTKRLRLDETAQTSSSTSSSSVDLLNFCDDLMLGIFSYLKPTDLLALSQCCQRLHRVVFDRTLWNFVDFRPVRLSDTELRKYVKFFQLSTKVIATVGPWIRPAVLERERDPEEPSPSVSEEAPTFTGELLESIVKAAPNLITLVLESHVIDSQDVTWDKVPPKLECLSLRSCHVTKIETTKSYFYGIDKCLPHLKKLDLSDCLWFESHSFLALSKCKALEELRLADCYLGDFVPYVSLGTRFGFKALTVVDFRRTWVSDREISCFNKTRTLRELYLESPGGERGSTMITDMAVTSFGGTLEDWHNMGYIVVLMAHHEEFMPSSLAVIQMCNYVSITDTSLRHCASCLKGLKRLNVRGTSCTQEGVIKFKTQRPDVLIESNFDLELDSGSKVDKT